MARSLVIQTSDGYSVTVRKGSGDLSIVFPVNGTMSLNNDSKTEVTPYEIYVEIDGKTDSQSFFVTSYDTWFKYWIERVNNQVKICITCDENLDTLSRLGNFIIKHKAAPLSINVDIEQEPTVYKLTAEYETNGRFNSFPKKGSSDEDAIYEEKSVTVTTEGGSGKWYIKKIRQYEAYNFIDNIEAIEDVFPTDYRGSANETQMAYDGTLQYYTDFENNKLIVRSYGRTDLSKEHMRYYFTLCHKDINNVNKINNEENVPYEQDVLFIFSDNAMNGYTEDNKPDDNNGGGDDTPDTVYKYVFKVDGSEYSHSIYVTNKSQEINISVISTENGEEYTWGHKESNGEFWSSIDGKEIGIQENKTFSDRSDSITYTQSRKDGTTKTIILTLIQEACENVWKFLVDLNANNFTLNPTIPYTGKTYQFDVISTKNGNNVNYSVISQTTNSRLWITYNEETKIFTFAENTTYSEREAVFMFKQENNSPLSPIYVTIKQEAKELQLYGYIVHYYIENTTTQLKEDYVVEKDTANKKYQLGEQVTYTTPYNEIEHQDSTYTLIGGATKTITIQEGDNVFIFYYSKQIISYEFFFTNEPNNTNMQVNANSDETSYTCEITSNKIINGVKQFINFNCESYDGFKTATINGNKLILTFDKNTTFNNKTYHVTLLQEESGNRLYLTLTQLGEGIFMSDYLTLKYTWSSGKDLDTATVLRKPFITEKITKDNAVGFNLSTSVIYNDMECLVYGGDNKNSGDEGALIEFIKISEYINNLTDKETWCKNNLANDNDGNGYYLLFDIYANWFEEYSDENVQITLTSNVGAVSYTHNGFTFGFNGGETKKIGESSVKVNASSPLNVNNYDEGYTKIATIKYYVNSGTAKMVTNTSSSWVYTDKTGVRVNEISVDGYNGTSKYIKKQKLISEQTNYYRIQEAGEMIPMNGDTMKTNIDCVINNKEIAFGDLNIDVPTDVINETKNYIQINVPKTDKTEEFGINTIQPIIVTPKQYNWIKAYIGNYTSFLGSVYIYQRCNKTEDKPFVHGIYDTYILINTNNKITAYIDDHATAITYKQTKYDYYDIRTSSGTCKKVSIVGDGMNNILQKTTYTNITTSGVRLDFKTQGINHNLTTWDKYVFKIKSEDETYDASNTPTNVYIDFENSLKLLYQGNAIYTPLDFMGDNFYSTYVYPDSLQLVLQTSDTISIKLEFNQSVTLQSKMEDWVNGNAKDYSGEFTTLDISCTQNTTSQYRHASITVKSTVNDCKYSLQISQQSKTN